jgi:hypothetical protein
LLPEANGAPEEATAFGLEYRANVLESFTYRVEHHASDFMPQKTTGSVEAPFLLESPDPVGTKWSLPTLPKILQSVVFNREVVARLNSHQCQKFQTDTHEMDAQKKDDFDRTDFCTKKTNSC